MLKKLLIVCIALAPLAAVAQDVKIGYINTQEIFASMPELSGIETQLSNKQEEITKNGQALMNEYNKKLEELEAASTTASEAIRQDQEKQLMQIYERYQLFIQNSQQEMGQLEQKLLEPVHTKIRDAIQSVGTENNFTYILDVANVVYVSPTAENVTPLVKSKLGLQ